MKYYEELEQLSIKHKQIDIHVDAIAYHQASIDKINSTTVEEDFYSGNCDFPDYPGNEWMKEVVTHTCCHCPEIMLINPTEKPTPNELGKLVCNECKERMWTR
jgi:hypothetical protein